MRVRSSLYAPTFLHRVILNFRPVFQYSMYELVLLPPSARKATSGQTAAQGVHGNPFAYPSFCELCTFVGAFIVRFIVILAVL